MSFDAAIVGAGPAGLLLARALVRGPLAGGRLLVVDLPSARADAHALAWWSDRPTPYDALAVGEWDRVRVAGSDGAVDLALGAWRYRVLRDADLHAAVRAELAGRDEVTWVDGEVVDLASDADGVDVRTGAEAFRARWAFDSSFHVDALVAPPGAVLLRQRFRGFRVTAPVDAFDPTLPTLMDLRFPQGDGVRFAYVLPSSRREALVELVALGGAGPVEGVEAFVRDALGIAGARIEPVEAGVTPMASFDWPRRDGRVLRIGIAGGRLKRSTGYGFLRMVEDADAVAASLARCGHPFALPVPASRWRWLDAVMLRVVARRPEAAVAAFLAMFRRVPVDRVLRFLDERGTWADVLRLGLRLPPGPFLGAVVAEVRAGLVRWRRAAIATGPGGPP